MTMILLFQKGLSFSHIYICTHVGYVKLEDLSMSAYNIAAAKNGMTNFQILSNLEKGYGSTQPQEDYIDETAVFVPTKTALYREETITEPIGLPLPVTTKSRKQEKKGLLSFIFSKLKLGITRQS